MVTRYPSLPESVFPRRLERKETLFRVPDFYASISDSCSGGVVRVTMILSILASSLSTISNRNPYLDCGQHPVGIFCHL